jgi:Methyltransferase domain
VNTDVVLAEIGVFSGGSLEMWEHYLGSGARIHGIDLDESTRSYASDRVSIHIGDQESRAFWRQFRKDVPQLHVMIDDGGHSPQQQRVSMEEILPHLQPGGVYICEDIVGESNDFSLYVGGLVASLNSGVSSLESSASGFQKAVYSIHCYPFITVVERTLNEAGPFLSQRRGTAWEPPLRFTDGHRKILGRGA